MPTKTLTGRLRIVDRWAYINTDDISAPRDEYEHVVETNWTSGDADEQVEAQYKARRSLLSNTEDALDLAGGLTDIFGETLTFATIKEILIVNLATTAAHVLKIGQLSTPTSGNLMTDLFDGDNTARIKLRAGGAFLITAPLTGYTVTGGSADVLLISNEGTGATIEYDVIVKGTLA